MEGAHHLILLFIICYFRDVCATDFENKIIGGNKINITSRPYQAVLKIKISEDTYGSCGGSIIGDGRFILTSANCLYGNQERYVAAGVTNIKKAMDDDESWHSVKKVYLHPRFERHSYDYDVGIAELSEPLPLDGVTMKAIEIVDMRTEIYDDDEFTLSGWGKLDDDEDNDLKIATFTVVPDGECENVFGVLYNSDVMFCVAGKDGGTDNCNGDIGSPVTFLNGEEQLGIFTIGRDCEELNNPSIFTKLSNYNIAYWIEETIENE